MLIDPLVPASLRAAELGVKLPLSFDRWLSRCVTREPAGRFANADEAQAELTRVLDGSGEPGLPKPSAPPVPRGAGTLPPPMLAPHNAVPDADGEKDATPARGTRSLYKATPPAIERLASSLPPPMALDAPPRGRPAWLLPAFAMGAASVITLAVVVATHSGKGPAAASHQADDAPSEAKSANQQVAAAPSSDWVTDPKSEPRSKTVLITVTPPPKLVDTFRTLSARVDNPRLKSLFGGFALGGSGSGFVLVKRHEPEPLVFVITNRHVISESESVEITLEDGTKVGGDVLYADYRHDVAVVGFSGKKPPVSAGLSLAPDAVADLDTVVATGYPFLAGKPSFQISKGEVRNHAFERSFDDDLKETYIQHSASIDPGSSGGPLLDTKNQVVGINTGFLPEKHDVFLALPASAITDAIAQATEIESLRAYPNLRTPGLYTACKELAAELASPKPRFSIFLQFISNRFIATDGFSSYLALGNELGVGSSVSTLFDADPMDGMRDALLVRLYAGVEEGGGVAQNPCGELNPTDAADMVNTPVIRMAFHLKDGQSEIGWTFEHGHWRVASGPLPGTVTDMKRHHR